jgi:hypothetical protein
VAQKIEIIVEATGFQQVEKGAAGVSKALASTAKEAQKLDSTLATGLKNGANQATQSLTNLGRVVQDAPFGFIGIANNINPLLESFQRLKAETGGTASSLKALGSSLLGAGGLGLAVSAITSLLVVFGDKLFSGKKAIESLNFELIEFDRIAQTATQTLKDFNKQQDSLLKLNNANIAERFGKTFEADLLRAKSRFISVAEEIVATEEAVKVLTENSSKAFNSFLSNSKDGYNIFTGVIKNSAVQLYDSFQNLLAIPEDAIEQLDVKDRARLKAAIAAEKARVEAVQKLKDLEQLRLIIAAENRALVVNENKGLEKRVKILKEVVKEFKNIKFAQEEINAPSDGVDATPAKKPFDQLDLDAAEIKGAISEINKLVALTGVNVERGFSNLNIEGLKRVLGDAKKEVADFSKLVKDLITEAFAGLGEGIGAAVTGGLEGIKQVFGSIINLVGDFLVKLGKAAIAQSKLLIALQVANPVVGLIAGIAAVALGTILRNQQFAVGTRNAPGGLALVGERGPELISVPRGSAVTPAAQTANILGGMQSIEVYGMVRGQDIYFSNKRFAGTLSRNT